MEFLNKYDKKVSLALQILSILAISSGFFGFVIVNLFFSLFGFWDFSFLKAQYFSTGLLFIFYVTLPFVIFHAFYKGEKILERYKEVDKTKWKSFLVSFWKIFIFLVLVTLNYFIIIMPLGSGNPEIYLGNLNLFVVVWIFLIYGLVSILAKYRKDTKEASNQELNFKNISTYFLAHFNLFHVVIAPFIFLMLFTVFIYPNVPRYFGGGKPVKAEIYLNPEIIPEFKEEKYLKAGLLYQSSEVVVIIVKDEVFQISKDYISYIKYVDTIFKRTLEPGAQNFHIKDLIKLEETDR